MVHVLVYVSTAPRLLSSFELDDILVSSRRRNEAAGVTGMLLYKDGNLMQVLEGEESAVRGVYDRIAGDRRHRDVLVVLDEEQSGRRFEDWSMAYRNLGDVDVAEVPGYSRFLNTPLVAQEFGPDPGAAQQLLAIFKATLTPGSPPYRLG